MTTICRFSEYPDPFPSDSVSGTASIHFWMLTEPEAGQINEVGANERCLLSQDAAKVVGMSTKSDVIIMTLAARSAGVVTRDELLTSGLPSSTINGRVSRGQLLRVWRGLYEVLEMTNDLTPLFLAVKAVAGSAVCHITAGRLYGCPVGPPAADEPVHIVSRRDGPRTGMPGVVHHRTRLDLVDDIWYPINGLPVLSPARTMLDLAADPSISNRRLRHIVESQIVSRQLEVAELAGLVEQPDLRGVHGIARLRTLVEAIDDGEPVSDSMLEQRFGRLLVDYGIDGFQRQFVVPWYDGCRGTVDFANVEARLIIEVDGRDWHTTSQSMTEDRRRDRTAAANGWLVMRVMWADIVEEPHSTAHQIIGTLVARRGSAA